MTTRYIFGSNGLTMRCTQARPLLPGFYKSLNNRWAITAFGAFSINSRSDLVYKSLGNIQTPFLVFSYLVSGHRSPFTTVHFLQYYSIYPSALMSSFNQWTLSLRSCSGLGIEQARVCESFCWENNSLYQATTFLVSHLSCPCACQPLS